VQQVPVLTLAVATSGPADTRAFAAALAPLLEASDVVALSGDLGAGKTCFVQGAVRGLGVETRVTSPTFVLVRQYTGRLPIVHCDVYRLDRLQDVHDLGDDVLAPEVVTFLEWADAVRPLLPDDRLEVDLRVPPLPRVADADADAAEPGSSGAGKTGASKTGAGNPTAGDVEVADIEEARTATVRGFGPRWAERADALTEAFGPWLAGQRRAAPPAAAPPAAADTASNASPTTEPVTESEPEDR
jgi:tRNA threonylcarbamoyladenosine biosynthesis protein TsaE